MYLTHNYENLIKNCYFTQSLISKLSKPPKMAKRTIQASNLPPVDYLGQLLTCRKYLPKTKTFSFSAAIFQRLFVARATQKRQFNKMASAVNDAVLFCIARANYVAMSSNQFKLWLSLGVCKAGIYVSERQKGNREFNLEPGVVFIFSLEIIKQCSRNVGSVQGIL
jgi:hypothetical protein